MSLTGKLIYVPVSDELHEKISQAAEANGDTFEEWVRNACLAEADYDIYLDQQRRKRRMAVKT